MRIWGRTARPVRHRRARLACVIVVALLATSCGDDGGAEDGSRWDNVVSGPEVSEVEPVTGGSLVVGLESETNSYLPPSFQGSQAGVNVARTLFDPLVSRDAEGEFRPYLAEALESNDDYTEWTLTLRPDVRFHDDTPLDAEALKRIFDDYLSESALTAGAVRDVDRVEVVDPLTVTYVLDQPHAQFPELFQLVQLSPFSPDAADELGDAFGDQPVGTGPFRFVSWTRDGDFVVERNPDYWQDGLPYLDEITFRPIPDETTRAASLASGEVDVIQSVRLSGFVAEVADTPDVEVSLGLGNGGGVVMFNTTGPPTDDVRIRQSLAHAVDQSALIEVAADEGAELTELRTQLYPSDSPFYSEAVAEAWPDYRPERAEELYQGYVDDPDRSDGEDPGEPVALTLTTTNVPGLVELAQAYEGAYEAVGFDVRVDPVEQDQNISSALTGDFQAALFRIGTNRSPLGELLFYFDDPEESLSNFTNFYDQTVVDVTERLRTTADVGEQAEAIEELGLHLAEAVPFQWTGSDLTFLAARDEVGGIRSWEFPDGALGAGAFPGVTSWGQVWLDE